MKKVLSMFIAVSFIFACNISYALEPSNDEIYEGVDISAWQNNINFASVKNAGIDVVYIKSSQGTDYIDPYFKNYYNSKML